MTLIDLKPINVIDLYTAVFIQTYFVSDNIDVCELYL